MRYFPGIEDAEFSKDTRISARCAVLLCDFGPPPTSTHFPTGAVHGLCSVRSPHWSAFDPGSPMNMPSVTHKGICADSSRQEEQTQKGRKSIPVGIGKCHKGLGVPRTHIPSFVSTLILDVTSCYLPRPLTRCRKHHLPTICKHAER